MAGVGSKIKEELATWGIYPRKKCRCKSLAQEMDKVGPDAVEENIDYYTQEMYDSIKEWRSTSRLPVPQPPLFTIKLLIGWAVRSVRSS